MRNEIQKNSNIFLTKIGICIITITIFIGTVMTNTTDVKAAALRTKEDAIAWIQSQSGKSLDYDGVYGAQCVDLICCYYAYLGAKSPGGNAIDYASNRLPDGWSRVYGDYQAGDIAVWYANIPNVTGVYGHVGIITSVASSTFTVMDQNGYRNKGYCQSNTYSSSVIKCAVRPTFAVPITTEFPLVNNGVYKIRNVNSGKVLEVPGASHEGGIQIEQCDDSNGTHQLWKAIQGEDGYSFVALHSNKALDIYGYSINEGGKLTHCAYHGESNQRFKLVHRGNLQYSIHPVVSNLALDVYGYSKDNHAQIYQYAYHGNSNQLFTFEFIDRDAPAISNARVVEVTGTSYTVACTVTDNVAVARVQFPSWGLVNGQNDLVAAHETNPAVTGQANGSEYTFTVRISDHSYETGAYVTHIYAYDTSGNWSKAELSAEVYPLLGISLNAESKVLQQGESFHLSPGYNPSNTTEPNKTVVWTSSNPAVASVENGTVTGLSAGYALITAAVGDKTALCMVTVEAPREPERPETPEQPETPETPEQPETPDTEPVIEHWPFTDVAVAPDTWKYEAVKYVYGHQIMFGISSTTNFAPDIPLNRAMFATVLYRMAGSPAVPYTYRFSDVEPGRYYTNAVLWCSNEGIVNGYMDGRYGIEDNITREQIAKMLCEYASRRGYDVSGATPLYGFTDYSDVSIWAVGYIEWAVNSGMISGKPNGDSTFRLDPKGQATRAECAKMLQMFNGKYQ